MILGYVIEGLTLLENGKNNQYHIELQMSNRGNHVKYQIMKSLAKAGLRRSFYACIYYMRKTLIATQLKGLKQNCVDNLKRTQCTTRNCFICRQDSPTA